MRAGSINRLGLVVTPLLLAVAHPQAHSAIADLPVRVFDLTGQPENQRQNALDTASAVLATGGVRIVWMLCAPSRNNDTICSEPLRHTERVVRLMPISPAWRREEGAALGAAVIDDGSNSGVFATVYADRVSWLAARATIDPSTLLGHVIAHELGHLLLGRSHTPVGLMRRDWSVKALRRECPGDWQFTKEQIVMLSSVRLRTPGISSECRGGTPHC